MVEESASHVQMNTISSSTVNTSGTYDRSSHSSGIARNAAAPASPTPRVATGAAQRAHNGGALPHMQPVEESDSMADSVTVRLPGLTPRRRTSQGVTSGALMRTHTLGNTSSGAVGGSSAMAGANTSSGAVGGSSAMAGANTSSGAVGGSSAMAGANAGGNTSSGAVGGSSAIAGSTINTVAGGTSGAVQGGGASSSAVGGTDSSFVAAGSSFAEGSVMEPAAEVTVARAFVPPPPAAAAQAAEAPATGADVSGRRPAASAAAAPAAAGRPPPAPVPIPGNAPRRGTAPPRLSSPARGGAAPRGTGGETSGVPSGRPSADSASSATWRPSKGMFASANPSETAAGGGPAPATMGPAPGSSPPRDTQAQRFHWFRMFGREGNASAASNSAAASAGSRQSSLQRDIGRAESGEAPQAQQPGRRTGVQQVLNPNVVYNADDAAFVSQQAPAGVSPPGSFMSAAAPSVQSAAEAAGEADPPELSAAAIAAATSASQAAGSTSVSSGGSRLPRTPSFNPQRNRPGD